VVDVGDLLGETWQREERKGDCDLRRSSEKHERFSETIEGKFARYSLPSAS